MIGEDSESVDGRETFVFSYVIFVRHYTVQL